MDIIKTYRGAGIILAYPLAFAYLKYFMVEDSDGFAFLRRILFVLGYILFNELVVRGSGKKPVKETYFWYSVMAVTAVTSVTGISDPVSMFALHLCAWYVAVLSCGILYEGKTGSFMLADLFNASILKPFTGFGNIFRDITQIRKNRKTDKSSSSITAGILSVIFVLPLFAIATALLCGINTSFDAAVTDVLNQLDLKWFFKNFHLFIFAFPVCLYLYGMISQSAGSEGAKEKADYEKLVGWRQRCHKLSPIIASVITGMFVILYLIFFVFEGNYLFSAFAGKLPEEFTAAEYARKGFFELTGVMFINMLVFLLVSYLSKRDVIGRKACNLTITALMSESVLFAIISFSKLALYYSRFGYTPKRLLAMWGTMIFAAGAVMVIASIFRRRDMSRSWIYFATCSFTLMNVVSSILALMY